MRASRLWALLLLLFTVVIGAWSLATPPFAAPDEQGHFVHAVAVVRGELSGEQVPYLGGTTTQIHLPKQFENIDVYPGCFAFQSRMTADCQHRLADDRQSGTTTLVTGAGRYPPAYYAVVGLPSLVWSGLSFSYWGGRVMSTLLSAGLLATAALAALRRGGWLPLTTLAATTPMALFLSGTLNPSGAETSAAIAAWTTGLLLVQDDSPSRRRCVAFAVAGSTLALIRPISPLWLAIVMLGVLVHGGVRRNARMVLRQTRVGVAVGALVAAAAVQGAFVLALGSLAVSGVGIDESLGDRVDQSLSLLRPRSYQLVGWFGWLDTRMPLWVYLTWGVVVALLLLVAVTRIRSGTGLVLLGVVAGSILIPLVIEVRAIPTVGTFWQGRYTLPVAVGIPLVAGALLSRRGSRPPRGVRAALLGPLLVVQVTCFVLTLARYTVGTGHGLGTGLRGPVAWNPPLPPLVLIGAFTAGLLALMLVLAGRRDPRTPARHRAARPTATRSRPAAGVRATAGAA